MTSPVRGVTILRIPYQADPEKADPRWAAAMKPGYSEAAWAREMEMDAHTGLGQAVFGRAYRRETHERPLSVDPMLPLLHGWDFGEGWPAHVWAQRTRHWGLRVLASLHREHTMLRSFVEQTIAHELHALGDLYANRRDFVDPAGNQKKDDGLKSIEVLRTFGYAPKWRGSEYVERHEATDGLLRETQEDGAPKFLIDPARNPELCEAFRSRYRMREDGKEPVREHPFIDVMNALQYLIVNTKPPKRPSAPPPQYVFNPVTGYGGYAHPHATPFATPGYLP